MSKLLPTLAAERQSISHPIGYEVLFEGTTPIIADIVFVHGLHGHRTETWSKGSTCWPRDLLPKEEALSNVRILSFGYDSSAIISRSDHPSLFVPSVSLIEGLCQKRKHIAGRPIIFVAHSLGGLILKDALDYSDRYQTRKPDLASILLATRGIIFLGTTHRGSGAGSLVESVASVVQAVQGIRDDLLRDLERHSHTLDRVRDGFCQILDKRKLTVFSFVEKLPMLDGKKVVDGGSGIISNTREHWGTIHADHVNMVKFSDRMDYGYGKVLYALERLLKQPPIVKSPLAGHVLQELGPSHPQLLLLGTTVENINITNINPYTNYGQYVSGGRIDNYLGKPDASHEVGPHSQITTFYDVPSLQVPNYVEREVFSRMRELLGQSGTSSLKRIVVLLGMGGAGKTQLALRYCEHAKGLQKCRAVFWLDASSRNGLYLSMEAIAKRLHPGRILNDAHEAVHLVREVLSSWTDGWLLVFDNLDDPSDLNDIKIFFPDSSRGSILVTSRCAGSTELGEAIRVDRMEEKEGLELLYRTSQVDMKERAAAQDILRRVEYLPLAIDHIRAYISYRQLPLTDFVEEYERRKHQFMVESPRFSSYLRILPGTEKPTTLTLMTTWEMSFKLLDVGQEKLGDILTVFAFFHPFSISEKLFAASDETCSDLAGQRSSEWNHQKFERAIVQMQEHSLLQFSRRERVEIVVALHPMVSEWLQLRLKHDKRSLLTYLRIAASHLVTYLDTTDQWDHALRREALSHIDIMRRNEGFHDNVVRFDSVCHVFGMFYFQNARMQDAETMWTRALAEYEKRGLEDKSTLDIVNNLGGVYVNQGRLADAEKMFKRALVGYEVAWGHEHSSTLDTVNNLGILYTEQGRLSDAEKMYNRALAGKERTRGPDHTSTLDTVSNLGNLYRRQGRLSDAERMYNLSLAGYEKAWGPEHTSTLNAANDLGILYFDQGRLSDAETMYNRALAGLEKACGPDHTSTLHTVNNLGNLYADQGRLSDAERMYNRALVGKKKAWGPEHTSTFDTVNNLGRLYWRQGRLSDAERMFDHALAGYEKAYGPQHSSTLNAVNNLGVLYVDQGRLSDAETMYNRAMAGFEKALGPDHPSTLDAVKHLGLLYWHQGRLSDAEGMFKRRKGDGTGPEHPPLKTVSDLGDFYWRQGQI